MTAGKKNHESVATHGEVDAIPLTDVNPKFAYAAADTPAIAKVSHLNTRNAQGDRGFRSRVTQGSSPCLEFLRDADCVFHSAGATVLNVAYKLQIAKVIATPLCEKRRLRSALARPVPVAAPCRPALVRCRESMEDRRRRPAFDPLSELTAQAVILRASYHQYLTPDPRREVLHEFE